MPRPIPVLFEELQSTLSELWRALSPLKVGAKKPKDGRTRQEKSRTAVVASAVAPDKAVRNQSALKPNKRSKASRAKLVLQGQYMTAVRSLSTRAKAEVKKVRAEQGVEAAIALARSKKR